MKSKCPLEILVVALVLVAGLSACEKSVSRADLPLNEVIPIKQGQVLENQAAKITLLMDSVINDSRCPSDVDCVWAGSAQVRFTFSKGDASLKFTLNSDISPVDSLVFDYRIELIELSPGPVSGKPIRQGEYSAKIKVTKD